MTAKAHVRRFPQLELETPPVRVQVDELLALFDRWMNAPRAPLAYVTALVLRAIVMTCDFKTGRSDAKAGYLQALAGCSRSQFHAALAELVRLGLIARRSLKPHSDGLPPAKDHPHHWGCRCAYHRGGAVTAILAGSVDGIVDAITRAEPNGRLVLVRRTSTIGARGASRRTPCRRTSLDQPSSGSRRTSPLDPSPRLKPDLEITTSCSLTRGQADSGRLETALRPAPLRGQVSTPPAGRAAAPPAPRLASASPPPANDTAPDGSRADEGEGSGETAPLPGDVVAAAVAEVVGAHREAMRRAPYAALPAERLAIAAALARGYTGELLARAVRSAAASELNREPYRREIPWILAKDERLAPLIGRSYDPAKPRRPKPARDEQIEIPVLDQAAINAAGARAALEAIEGLR